MEPRIKELFGPPAHRLDVCVAFALLWIAAADGVLNPQAYAYLNRHADNFAGGMQCSDALLAIIADNELKSFLLASRGLRELNETGRHNFLRLALGAATAGGAMSISANHILRFYADLLEVEEAKLSELCREMRGGDLPEPGDPSSPQWWSAQAQANAGERGPEQEEEGDSTKHQRHPGRDLSRLEAFAVLGLERDVSRVEIKRAYRRLVQSYHPDRYEAQGVEARAAAEQRFIEVQRAYEVLSR